MTTGWDIAGTIADSAAALGTLAAAWVAAVVYRRQVNDNRRQSASAVTFVVDIQNVYDDIGTDTEHVLESHEVYAVRNHGHLPVTDVRLFAKQSEQKYAKWSERATAHVHELQPGQSVDRTRPNDGLNYEFQIKFFDAAGYRWERSAAGALRKASN